MFKKFAILALAGLAQTVSAEVLTFQEGVNGYTGTQDTYLYTRHVNTDFGGWGNMGVVSDGKQMHALLRFDNLFGEGAGQIRQTDNIASATLTLTVIGGSGAGGMSIHNMLSAWSESSTWSSMGSGISANGTEASSSSLGTFSGLTVAGSTISVDVLSSLQLAQSGGIFTGWALLPPSSGPSWTNFYTSEAATDSLRPLLTVNVASPTTAPVPVPAALPLMLSALGGLGFAVRKRSV